jgi:hypothetical protein
MTACGGSRYGRARSLPRRVRPVGSPGPDSDPEGLRESSRPISTAGSLSIDCRTAARSATPSTSRPARASVAQRLHVELRIRSLRERVTRVIEPDGGRLHTATTLRSADRPRESAPRRAPRSLRCHRPPRPSAALRRPRRGIRIRSGRAAHRLRRSGRSALRRRYDARSNDGGDRAVIPGRGARHRLVPVQWAGSSSATNGAGTTSSSTTPPGGCQGDPERDRSAIATTGAAG